MLLNDDYMLESENTVRLKPETFTMEGISLIKFNGHIFTFSNLIIFLILLINSLAIYWSANIFSFGYFLWADAFSLYPNVEFGKNFYMWDIREGVPNFFTEGAPLSLMLSGLQYLGIPLWILNKSVFILPTLIRGVGTYLLASSILNGSNWIKRISCLMSALFFMGISLDVYANPIISIPIAFFPLSLYFLIEGLKNSNRISNVYIILISFSWIFVSIHPTLAFIIVICITLYIIFQLIIEKSQKKHIIYFTSKLFLFIFLIESFHYLPLIYKFFTQDMSYQISLVLIEHPIEALLDAANQMSLVYTSRLTFGGQPSISYYSAPLIIFLGFFLVIFAYSSIFTRNKYITYFCLTAVLFTFVPAAVSIPILKDIFLLLFRYILLIRNVTYYLYPVALSYSIMLGCTIYYLLFKISHIKKYRVGKALISLILIFLFIFIIYTIELPAYTGYGFRGNNSIIPQEYFDLREVLLQKAQMGDKIYSVHGRGYKEFVWSDFHMTNILLQISPIQAIGAQLVYSDKTFEVYGAYFEKGDIASLVKIFETMGVRFIFIPKDLPEYNYTLAQDTMKKNSNLFKVIMNTQYFALYQLNSKNITPLFYFSEGNKGYDADNEISCNIDNPTKSTCILNITEPGTFVFNQNYDRGWMAYINGEQLPHINYNNMNGWLINKTGNNIAIELEYYPQRYVYIGVATSIITALILIIFLYRVR